MDRYDGLFLWFLLSIDAVRHGFFVEIFSVVKNKND